MDGIRIDLDDRAVHAALRRLAERAGNLFPALDQIGKALAETTKQRFALGRTPDGTPWAPNSRVTVDAFIDVFARSREKDGSRSKRGVARAGSKGRRLG